MHLSQFRYVKGTSTQSPSVKDLFKDSTHHQLSPSSSKNGNVGVINCLCGFKYVKFIGNRRPAAVPPWNDILGSFRVYFERGFEKNINPASLPEKRRSTVKKPTILVATDTEKTRAAYLGCE